MQQPYMSQPSISCLVERILGRREKKISGFPRSSVGKESGCNAGDLGSIPGSGRSPETEMATHSSIFAWRIP